MGSSATTFHKALISGNESLAWEIYDESPKLKKSLNPNASYGTQYRHNTPLHYASRHAMSQLLRLFLLNKDGDPKLCNADKKTALHLLCMDPHIPLEEGKLQTPVTHAPEDEGRRLDCLRIILQQAKCVNINAADKKRNTCLHYAAASGMKACVELLVQNGANLFAVNKNREMPCDCAKKQGHSGLALSLQFQMVFSGEDEHVWAEHAALDLTAPYEGLTLQDLQRLKDMLIVEMADMLQVPLFTAEALLRAHNWDQEMLLDAWIFNAESCCQRSGVPMPRPPPSGCNTWDTLPSLRTTRTTRSSVMPSCGICMCPIPVFEDPVDMPCGHEFCRACWEEFLNLKIQEGAVHSIVCPGYDCFQLVSVEIIECVVSQEMNRRYQQFDLKAFVANNPAIRWCPMPGCKRAVRLTPHISDANSQGLLVLPQAPAVDCGKGHLFCWECLGEAHEPCDCQIWTMWLQTVSEMQSEETAHLIKGCEEATATSLWLLGNTKPCAKCKAPIQKIGGCRHMTCSKCKHEFCWYCLDTWGQTELMTCTGKNTSQLLKKHAMELTNEGVKKNIQYKYFMQYYTHYKDYKHSYKREQRLLKKLKEKIEQLSRAFGEGGDGSPDTTFIEHAVHELFKARRILRYSYPYGYFLKATSIMKKIFDRMQSDLKVMTEDLAQKVKQLRTPRSKIIHATCLVQQKKKEFLALVAHMIPSDTAACTPAEETVLEQNHAHPIIEEIEGGTSSEVVPPSDMQSYVQVVGSVLTLLDSLDEPQSVEPAISGPSRTQEDEETISVSSEMLVRQNSTTVGVPLVAVFL